MVMTRRHWVAALGLTPIMGALLARVQVATGDRAAPRLSGRERIRLHHLPNVDLVAHTGQRLRFYDDLVKNKKVLINFMYAKCKGICVPDRESGTRAEAARRPGGTGHLHVLDHPQTHRGFGG